MIPLFTGDLIGEELTESFKETAIALMVNYDYYEALMGLTLDKHVKPPTCFYGGLAVV